MPQPPLVCKEGNGLALDNRISSNPLENIQQVVELGRIVRFRFDLVVSVLTGELVFYIGIQPDQRLLFPRVKAASQGQNWGYGPDASQMGSDHFEDLHVHVLITLLNAGRSEEHTS